MPGVTGELVSGAFADPAHVHFVADWQEAADYTATVAREGDYVITLGCGNVYQIIPQVLEALSRTPDAASAAATKRRSSTGCAGRRRFRRPRTPPRRRRTPCGVASASDLGRPPMPSASTRATAARDATDAAPDHDRRAGHPADRGHPHAAAGGAPRCRSGADDAEPTVDEPGATPRGLGAPRAPAARRCAPRCAASPAASGAGVCCGSGARHPSSSSCSPRSAPPTARCSPSSRSASSARSSSTPLAVEAALERSARHAAAARRRERGQGRARDVPARRVVLARGAPAARAGRAHRRAHPDRPDPDPRRLHAGRRRRCRPVDDRDARRRAVRCVTVAGGTGSPAFEAVGQVMRSLPESIRDAGDGCRRRRRRTM